MLDRQILLRGIGLGFGMILTEIVRDDGIIFYVGKPNNRAERCPVLRISPSFNRTYQVDLQSRKS